MSNDGNEAEITRRAIGDRIKQLRVKKGFKSHEDFALHVGMDGRNYFDIEKGRNVTINTLIKIAKGLDVPLSRIFRNI